MSDVRETAAPPARNDNGPNPAGDFIWYELMTTDADGAKAFYDPVTGWDIGEGAAEYGGYRMINAGGGFAGGLLPLTDELQQNGARPTWLGYVYVPDVDKSLASIDAAGGKSEMPATAS